MTAPALYRPPQSPCLGGKKPPLAPLFRGEKRMKEFVNNTTDGYSSSLSREERGGSEVLPTQGEFRRVWMTADPMEYELMKENARSNRKNMTEAESVFWSLVKGGSLGQRCLRQHIIGDYIVDFLFRKSKVVVEIDGGYHFTEEQQKDDVIRDARGQVSGICLN